MLLVDMLVLLLDLWLDDSKGVETVTRVRAVSDSAIIVISGRSDLDLAKQCIAADADAFLDKNNLSAKGLALCVQTCIQKRYRDVILPGQERLVRIKERSESDTKLEAVVNRFRIGNEKLEEHLLKEI